MGLIRRVIAGACTLWLAGAAWSAHAAVIVQLRVVEGEGSVFATGSRASRGITVQVTDETGNPVDGATVSFRLPDQGPSGAFTGGLRSEVVTTRVDGRAAIWGMQWNKTPGPFEIRITAIKDQARAGIVSSQFLSDAAVVKAGGSGAAFQPSHHARNKWLIVAVAIAGGAGAGLAFGRSHSTPAATAAPVVPTLIGFPTVIVGAHP